MGLLPSDHQSGLFINAPLKAVAKCIVRWGDELEEQRVAERRLMPLAEAWPHVDEERAFNPYRAFLISVGYWTAYFDNHSREFLAQAHLAELCRRIKADTCFYSYDDRTPGMEGSAHFCHCRPAENEAGINRRQVMLTHDGGWQFHESGEPLPYEDTETYKRRKKMERLTPELLRKYGLSVGLPFWDESTYGKEVVLLRWKKW